MHPKDADRFIPPPLDEWNPPTDGQWEESEGSSQETTVGGRALEPGSDPPIEFCIRCGHGLDQHKHAGLCYEGDCECPLYDGPDEDPQDDAPRDLGPFAEEPPDPNDLAADGGRDVSTSRDGNWSAGIGNADQVRRGL
jgi:hypothetical protein